MSAKRITMRKIRDILRLRHAAGLSIRQIRASTKVSVGAIQKLLAKAEEEDLGWPLPPELDDDSRPVFVNEVVAFTDHAALRSCLLSA